MVPLVGLGSNQVNKCSNPDNFIEGYRLNELRGTDSSLLRKRLLSLGEYEADNVAIFLYASPQSLDVGQDWHRTLMTLSSKNLIKLIVGSMKPTLLLRMVATSGQSLGHPSRVFKKSTITHRHPSTSWPCRQRSIVTIKM